MTVQQNETQRLTRALDAIRQLRQRIETLENTSDRREPIAVIGMSCRFPGANTPEDFQNLLQNGNHAITEMPANRWDLDAYYSPLPPVLGKMYTRHGGFVNHIDAFDAQFFGISPVEVANIDPQQRLLLEVGWEALENAACNPKQLENTATGVFIGISQSDYAISLNQRDKQAGGLYSVTGTANSVASARLAYLLGLQGPNLAVDTACSSSLVALHLAIASLQRDECDLALVGGVNVLLSPHIFAAFCEGRALAEDGRCKSFDARADGYVRSEGCGIVVLKRLSDALAANDNIAAVIHGSAVNQDGRSNGLTAPNGLAQQMVIRAALAEAQLSAEDIGYVEAHGTGTSLGDPIEIAALGAVFAERKKPLWVGSVKSNIGHLEAAAGMAGLIKTILILENAQIPANLHFETPNPHIPWENIPIKIPTRTVDSDIQYAGVSSFGFSGTNAHIILGVAPEIKQSATVSDRDRHIITLSAPTSEALRSLGTRYHDYLAQTSGTALADLAYTTAIGRATFRHRLAMVASDVEEFRTQLIHFLDGERSKIKTGEGYSNPKIAFLFTGQGSQYFGMGTILYEAYPVFREALQTCDRILREDCEWDISLIDLLYDDVYAEGTVLDDTQYAQPALFAIGYALYLLWDDWGIKPYVLLGHSTGEYIAACVAGSYSLQDGLKLIAKRAKLIAEMARDALTIAALADAERIESLLIPYADTVSIAGYNSPKETLIAGDYSAVLQIQETLSKEGIDCRSLKIPYAPHSPLMNSILDEFESFAQKITYHPTLTPLISNVTGELVRRVDAKYWRDHLREPVQLIAGVRRLEQFNCDAILELGAQPVLQLLCRQNWQGGRVKWLASLAQVQDDWQQMLTSLRDLYLIGASVNWKAFDAPFVRRKLRLPYSIFERTHYPLPSWNDLPVSQKHDQTINSEGYSRTVDETIPTSNDMTKTRTAQIEDTIRLILSEHMNLEFEKIPSDISFLSLGADSLLLSRLSQDIDMQFQIEASIGQLFDGLDTIERLAHFLDTQLPLDWQSEKTSPQSSMARASKAVADEQSLTNLPNNTSALERIIAQQITLMQEQLVLLNASASDTESNKPKLPNIVKTSASTTPQMRRRDNQLARPQAKTLSSVQQAHLDQLIWTYTKRTAASKQRATEQRKTVADTRSLRLFRMETKDMVYPIVGMNATGAYFQDIDGNNYIDLAMGIGALLLGHTPPVIAEAISQQLNKKIQTGPTSELALEVSQLICELTGVERVLFAVTGTGAVRGALRLARAVRGRSKFVMFSGAYHGQSDATLMVSDINDPLRTLPMVTGVAVSGADDVMILPYGRTESLEIIKDHADELAAVLIEPVQSRNPDVQPVTFLRELRQITADMDIPLIFDEVITGFRVHPGGAQHWFGIEADIVTYGKAIGGGMPLSVIGGKARYLDGIDGGQWQYGDDSYPQIETTFIGSTFEMHPLALASSFAILSHLKAEGFALQQALNRKVEWLANTLNTFFDDLGLALKVIHFASLFRFVWKDNTSYLYQPLEMEIFHYHLIAKGIYIWEGRTCFLSTAHQNEDLAKVVVAVKDTVQEMLVGGFFENAHATPNTAVRSTNRFDVSAEQALLFHWMRNHDKQGSHWVVPDTMMLSGFLRSDALNYALNILVDRHEALRTVFSEDLSQQIVLPSCDVAVTHCDLTDTSTEERETAIQRHLSTGVSEPFDLQAGPLFRVIVISMDEDEHILSVILHHSICDGWSMGIIVGELAVLYTSYCQGQAYTLNESVSYHDFLVSRHDDIMQKRLNKQRRYWLEHVSRQLPVLLPADYPRLETYNQQGARFHTCLSENLTHDLLAYSQAEHLTPFMLMFSVYALIMHKLTKADDLYIGFPVAARTKADDHNVVGYCTHLLAIRSKIADDMSIKAYFHEMREVISHALEHQDYSFAMLLKDRELADTPNMPLLTSIFNLDQPIQTPEFKDLDVTYYPSPNQFALTDFRLDVLINKNQTFLDYDYRSVLFHEATIIAWHNYYVNFLEGIINQRIEQVKDLKQIKVDL